MSVLDCILLGIGTIIIPGILYSLALLAFAGAFSKKNEKISENEFNREEYTEKIVDNKDVELGHNRTDYHFITSPEIKKWIDSYEKNIPKLEWTPEEIKKFEEEAAKWKEENKERIEAYDKEENQRLIDAINELEEYEKEHPNEKSMVNSCMLKWMVGWKIYEEKLIKEGHSPSSYEAKPRISDIF